jgi:hypothetical protein
VCDVATGKVEFMGQHPWQAELIAAMDAGAPSPSETVHAEPGAP